MKKLAMIGALALAFSGCDGSKEGGEVDTALDATLDAAGGDKAADAPRIPEGGEQVLTTHSNGQKASEAYTVDGKKEGLEQEWYDDGTLKAERNYKNGELNGKSTEYFPTGTEKRKGSYANAKRDGEWVELDETGNALMRQLYNNGEKVRPEAPEAGVEAGV
ncbi:hypothetical protein KAI87_12040, partial [Myxococcota bacterium]|nr:hypothetical protein [Myxococcota bacterium]